MEELKVTQQQGIISANLDEIEAEIKQQMKDYEDYVVSADSIKSDKKTLADLRKLKTSLDDSRKEVKKAWLAPYEQFEERCKSVIALVDAPINLINSQIKMFEEEKKLEKVEHIKELYAENIQDLERFLPFEKVMEANPKWTNASTKDSDITYDLSGMILKVKNDLTAIQALNSEIEQEVIDCYVNFGNDLSMAIQRNSQYLADKQKLEEKAKAEAERKAQEEAEKAQNVEEVVQNDVQNVEETPLTGSTLDNLVQMTKTVKIIISAEDLEQVEQTLKFMDVRYRVVEE